MKTIKEVKLELNVGDLILDMVRDAQDGKLDSVTNSDLQGIVQAKAMHIIKMVREAA